MFITLLLVAVVLIMDTFPLAAPSLYRRRRGAAVSERTLARLCAGWRLLLRPTRPALTVSGPASNCAAGRWHQARSCFYAGWRLRLPPTCPAPTVSFGPASNGAAGRWHQARAAFIPVAAAPPGLQPQITAGAGLLKLPVLAASTSLRRSRKWGSPHGCGLRAVFCRDAASARPEACRDSRRDRAAAMFGRSPGRSGAATGRPLCAPSAMTAMRRQITGSAIGGSNIEAVALLSAARAGTFPVRRYSPGGGWRLTRPTGAS